MKQMQKTDRTTTKIHHKPTKFDVHRTKKLRKILPCKKSCIFKRHKYINIPTLTIEQKIEVDCLIVADYGIELIQMMENAGRSLADLTRRLFGASLFRRTVCVLCGRVNNGEGGITTARHLYNHGTKAHVIRLDGPLKVIPAKQW